MTDYGTQIRSSMPYREVMSFDDAFTIFTKEGNITPSCIILDRNSNVNALQHSCLVESFQQLEVNIITLYPLYNCPGVLLWCPNCQVELAMKVGNVSPQNSGNGTTRKTIPDILNMIQTCFLLYSPFDSLVITGGSSLKSGSQLPLTS